MGQITFGRRTLGLTAAALLTAPLAGCGRDPKFHNLSIAGSLPPLAFRMTRAADGREVTAADYRGRVVVLYFGYTNCPDICPLTLANLAIVLKRLGPLAGHVSVLFATVDPKRDTLPVLEHYVATFAPEIVGLRGTDNQIAELARRFRVAYSVDAPTESDPTYEVSHSAAVFVFDTTGAARLIVPSMASTKPDIDGTAADLTALIKAPAPGFFARLLALL